MGDDISEILTLPRRYTEPPRDLLALIITVRTGARDLDRDLPTAPCACLRAWPTSFSV